MSTVELKIPERAALLALMTFVEEASNPDMEERYGFSIDKKVRIPLEEGGYVTSRRLKGVPGQPYAYELTEKGWRWCRDELGQSAPAEKGTPKAYRLLYGILNSFDRHMRRSQLQMEHIFVVVDPAATEKRIRAAYEELVAEPAGWVGLRRLREELPDLSRADIDAALLALDLQPGVYLEPESNQKTLSDADWDAAIRIGGEAKHLLSIEHS